MLKCFTAALGVAMLALPTSAQDAAKQTEEILAELCQIRVLLETRLNTPSMPNVVQAPTTSITVDVRTAPFLGSKGAPLVGNGAHFHIPTGAVHAFQFAHALDLFDPAS